MERVHDGVALGEDIAIALCRGPISGTTLPMAKEFHVSSLVVHGAAKHLASISAEIAVLPGAEVHASDGNGKLVVTLETGNEAEISERVAAIRSLDGVYAASLVYHQVEAADAEDAESMQ